MLVQTAEREMKENKTNIRGNMTDAKIHKVFDDNDAAWKNTSRRTNLNTTSERGVMLPDDIDVKSGKPVSEILHHKHPATRTPDY